MLCEYGFVRLVRHTLPASLATTLAPTTLAATTRHHHHHLLSSAAISITSALATAAIRSRTALSSGAEFQCGSRRVPSSAQLNKSSPRDVNVLYLKYLHTHHSLRLHSLNHSHA